MCQMSIILRLRKYNFGVQNSWFWVIFIYELGTFPKAYSQGRLPKWWFPKWQLPKHAISKTGTSQRLGLALRGADGCNGGQGLQLGWTRWPSATYRTGWGPIATARTELGSCTFGKFPLGKILLGSCHLEKFLWEST